MAFIQVNFYSDSLCRSVPINALIPNDLQGWQIQDKIVNDQPMKTLYLLPGYGGSHQDWILNSTLQDLSCKYHLAIITVAGENSFYVDREATGFAYGKYVGEELVQYTRRLFNLSTRREDTYIGGLSMGGYGALRNGLKYADTFSKIVALSSALIVEEVSKMKPGSWNKVANYDYYVQNFGDLDKLLESDKNPKWLYEKLERDHNEIPEIFMACGSEDFLIEPNRDMVQFLKDHKAPLTYKEGPGVHDWVFWSEYIKQGVCWIMGEE